MERIFCIVIGYLCGSFLMAELVVRHATGKRPKEIGTGNPGMANVMAEVGKKEGFLVLAGDVGKTVLACLAADLLFSNTLGKISILYAGIGAVLGHNYPAWNHFEGGKGVTVTCTFSILFSPLWGTCCCLAGAAVVLVSGYLSIGGMLIPLLYLPAMLICGQEEAAILASASIVFMVIKHYKAAVEVLHGRGKRVLLFRRKA